MFKTIFSLVSEQRLQNIIPIFQAGAQFDQCWLVRSRDADVAGSKFARALSDTQEALRSSLQVYSVEPAVGAYGIEETHAVISRLIPGQAGKVVINFTGGTKCISVGAYLAAQSAGVPALYVDTADEKIVWFHPAGRVEEIGFDLQSRLTVRVYLQANGRQVDEARTSQHAMPMGLFLAAEELLTLWPQCRDTLHAFGKALAQNREVVNEQEVSQETIRLLEKHQLVEQTSRGWQSTRTGRNFLGGKWLDAMTCHLLQKNGRFDDVQPELRLKGVENELDVMATKNGVLAVIECKSGELGGQTTLNRLQAIRSNLGTFLRAFFVTSRDAAQVDRDFIERANQYGFRYIITAETLLPTAALIEEKMRGTPS